jgi:glycosyltransferase involved in cell wall biosynthesis
MQPYRIYNYNVSQKPVFSVVTPIYNQELIIVKNLRSVIENTMDFFEILLILDFCFDKTEEKLLEFLDSYQNLQGNLCQIRIFKNTEKPLFETKCDNIGFRASNGTYCLEIQADMEMTQKGYNLELVKPFHLLANVIAVSGRCAHSMFGDLAIGKLGEDIEKSLEQLNIERNIFYILETCNRGPLLLDRAKLEELGFLNELDYFLDNSDHDLMARAYLQKQYICGYVPIDFNSPLRHGSTRKLEQDSPEHTINKIEKERLSNICNSSLIKYISVWKSRDPKFIRLD